MSSNLENVRSILFVCMGNICRSPAGENVMRKLLQEEGLASDLLVDSAGTINFHSGNAPDSRMSAAGRRRGLPMTGSARQVRQDDFQKFDLILAMDNENYANLAHLAASPAEEAKIKRFCEFCADHSDTEVPDPYYGGAQGFEHVLDLLEDGCSQILQKLKK
ncbi:MAG: low molecular weight protein-tyrosine-phosphatase [Verrucomicrobiota bacterium]